MLSKGQEQPLFTLLHWPNQPFSCNKHVEENDVERKQVHVLRRISFLFVNTCLEIDAVKAR